MGKKDISAVASELGSPGILKRVNKEPIILDATDGIANATDTFHNGIYGFEQSKSAQVLVNAYDLVKNATFIKMLASILPILIEIDGSLNKAVARTLCCTQNQIIKFCNERPNWLSKSGATFFLFEENGEFFVVFVVVFSVGFAVRRNRLENSGEWAVKCAPRFVLPHLA
jgi:hypothetical protein